jgi:hypothetical protein
MAEIHRTPAIDVKQEIHGGTQNARRQNVAHKKIGHASESILQPPATVNSDGTRSPATGEEHKGDTGRPKN